MKELRPPSSGKSEIRMLFAFDPAREAIIGGWGQVGTVGELVPGRNPIGG